MSINKIIFLLLIYLYLAEEDHQTPPTTIQDLTCGKNRAKKEKDCTKYGTGSGMLCCWVAKAKSDKSGKCYLLPESLANSKGIDGSKEFTTGEYKYWSCGNKSIYLKINIIILSLIVFLF